MMYQSSVHRQPHKYGVKALTKDLIFTKTRNDNLQGIKNLNLWGNDLQDLSLLNQMPNLEVISLSVNNIKTLKYFENCFKLQELYLRKNSIQLLDQIQYLMNLPELKVLWLCDNPCANNKKYRQIVLRNLPNLIKLDNDLVNQSQKQLQQQSLGIDAADQQGLQSALKNQREIQKGNSSKRQTNYQPINTKQHNILHQLQENKSQLFPHKYVQNSADRKSYQQSNNSMRKAQSLLKQSEKKKLINNEMQQILAYRDQTSSKKYQKNLDMNQKDHFQSHNNNYSSMTPVNRTQNMRQNNKISQAQTINPSQFPVRTSTTHQERSPNLSKQQNKQGQLKPPNQKRPKSTLTPLYQHPILTSQTQSKREYDHKVSSPNIIMAIMSLLQDLDQEGLQIIMRQAQTKLSQTRSNKPSQIQYPK